MTLSAGPAAASVHADVVRPPADASELIRAAQLNEELAPDPLQVIDCSAAPSADIVGLELEEVDDDEGRQETAEHDAVFEAPTSQREARGLGSLLIGRDTAAFHAARGPPAS